MLNEIGGIGEIDAYRSGPDGRLLLLAQQGFNCGSRASSLSSWAAGRLQRLDWIQALPRGPRSSLPA
jgi:hypothetical protein